MPPSDLKVLIVGGGIAGLTLAILLERAGITYEVFERQEKIRALGSALSIGPNVLPMMEQLGILEQVLAIAKTTKFLSNFNEDMQLTSTIDYSELKERNGYDNYVVARPALYDLLHSLIPREKMHLGKRLVSIQDDGEQDGKAGGVTITFDDKTTAHGDILVGADGAYSKVRGELFAKLDLEGVLPPEDKEGLQCSSICLVGQTGKLSAEKFPYILQEDCRFENISGKDKPYTWLTFAMHDTICWMVIEHLHTQTYAANVKTADWGSAYADSILEMARTFPIPSGDNLTLGDLIDETPRELISQVALEGKFFETWYHKNTVLMGDACHKIYPSQAVGAMNAIQDAVSLSNYLYHVAQTEKTPESITQAFEGYYQERVELARAAYNSSDQFRRIFRGRMASKIVRFLFAHLPQVFFRRIFDQLYGNRPQLIFLPRVPDRGLIKAFPQKSLSLSSAVPSA